MTHRHTARLPHRPVNFINEGSTWLQEFQELSVLSSLLLQGWICTTEKTVVNGTCYYQLYLEEARFISIQQIPWRTSNACITWLNRIAVVQQFFLMPRVSNDNGHYLLNFSCFAQQFKIYWEQKIEIFHLKWILCCRLDYTAQGGQAKSPSPQLHL